MSTLRISSVAEGVPLTDKQITKLPVGVKSS